MSGATEVEDFKACDTCSAKEFGMGDVRLCDGCQHNRTVIANLLEQRRQARGGANIQKWVVHIVGPDDVIQKVDEMDALRSANAVNIEIERERRRHANNPNYPFAIALAKKDRRPLL